MKTKKTSNFLSTLANSFFIATLMLFFQIPIPAYAQSSQQSAVSALGRLEPEGGIIRVAAPSTPEAVSGSMLLSLHAKEGDQVESGTLLAVTGSAAILSARKDQAEAEHLTTVRASEAAQSEADEACVLADVATREAQRRVSLLEQKLASQEETELALGKAQATAASCTAAHANARVASSEIKVAESRVAVAQAELNRAYIKSPFKGRVLHILVQPGEFIGSEGLLELGRTDRMYAIAEVYETDIRRVKIGQTATINSDALISELHGKVELIRHKVQKHDVTGTDPAAARDARIIEVEILLDDPEAAESLSHLQVEIIIDV
ncbi:MAG: HlyD family efflux transporter periplasmic adaptor subunit [Xanthomonadales bacterium]|nr:HlyD family efflux transporter periplasmic adaptor subunit [Xanthomonadales bacterium]